MLLAAFIAGLVIAGAVEAKQQCSVSAGSHGYWSWRMIDGRKCWYEGKPMLSRAMLEWPAESAAQPDTRADAASVAPERRRPESQRAESERAESQRAESQRAESQRAESQRADSQRAESQRAESQRAESQRAESQRAESHGDPMDAQAYAPADSQTFEALWRDRIEGSRR